jgi:hypothetical protein
VYAYRFLKAFNVFSYNDTGMIPNHVQNLYDNNNNNNNNPHSSDHHNHQQQHQQAHFGYHLHTPYLNHAVVATTQNSYINSSSSIMTEHKNHLNLSVQLDHCNVHNSNMNSNRKELVNNNSNSSNNNNTNAYQLNTINNNINTNNVLNGSTLSTNGIIIPNYLNINLNHLPYIKHDKVTSPNNPNSITNSNNNDILNQAFKKGD